jgi:hypothetical protein
MNLKRILSAARGFTGMSRRLHAGEAANPCFAWLAVSPA